jgi:hypothetical protein
LLMSSASFAIFSLLQQTRAKAQSTKMSGWIHQELAMVPKPQTLQHPCCWKPPCIDDSHV